MATRLFAVLANPLPHVNGQIWRHVVVRLAAASVHRLDVAAVPLLVLRLHRHERGCAARCVEVVNIMVVSRHLVNSQRVSSFAARAPSRIGGISSKQEAPTYALPRPAEQCSGIRVGHAQVNRPDWVSSLSR